MTFANSLDFLSRNRILLLKTLCILSGNMFYSITENIIGPVLVDLSFIYNSEISSVELGTGLLFFGYMLGSFISSLYRWLNRQLVLVFILVLQVFAFVMIPYLTNVWQYYMVIILFGFCGGGYESSAIVWIVEMWTSSSRSFLHILQTSYSIGMVIAPLLVAPYLFGEQTSIEDVNLGVTTNITNEIRRHSMQKPFVSVASVHVFIPLTLLILYFVQPFDKKVEGSEQKSKDLASVSFEEISETASVAKLTIEIHEQQQQQQQEQQQQIPYRALKFIFAGLAYATYLSLQLNFIFFQTTMWQLLDVRMSAQEAATTASTFSAAHTIGRLVTIFISIKVIPDVIISYHYFILIVGQVILFLGRNQRLWIMIGTILSGLGFSALMAGHLAFTSRHLGLGKLTGTIYSFTSGLLGLTIPIIISHLIYDYPLILFQCSAIFLSISISSFVIVVCLIKFGSKK